METLPMLRHYKNGNGWEFLILTKEENERMQEALRTTNEKIFCESFEFAERFFKATGRKTTTNQLLTVAEALFNKRAIASFSAYQEYLKYLCAVRRNKNGSGV